MLMTKSKLEFPVAKDLKPARGFIANSLTRDDGYAAQWAAPGMVPRVVLDANGGERRYDSPMAAEHDARRVMFEALNSGIPTSDNKAAAYTKMRGPEFAVALSETDLSPSWLAFVMANSFARVIDWINGAQDVPHVARVLLEIFKRHPEAIDTAEEVTEAVASERVRKPPRQPTPN